MLGEMRDPETAEVAVQAALTGHIVFSTLHTNDAVSAVPRLIDLGIPPYLLAATLEGVLAQRLVRVICDACRVAYQPNPAQIAALKGTGDNANHDTPGGYSRGAGCPTCRQTGYRGRVGLFELVVVTDDFRNAITIGAPRSELREIAAHNGTRSLAADGWSKVVAGVTTIEEVFRVAQH